MSKYEIGCGPYRLDPFNPNPEHIHVPSVITTLAREQRWSVSGIQDFLSVAQHSVLCALWMRETDYFGIEAAVPGSDKRIEIGLKSLKVLFHDAHEAVFRDIPSPLKRHPCLAPRGDDLSLRAGEGSLLDYADQFQRAIECKVGIHEVEDTGYVRRADIALRDLELYFLHPQGYGTQLQHKVFTKPPHPWSKKWMLKGMPPGNARQYFLDAYRVFAAEAQLPFVED